MIPVCEPELGEEELRNVIECIKSKAISGIAGEFIPEFELKLSEYCGKRHGVATSSGTTALHLAIAALEIGPGDEVILSAFTNIATALAIVHNGAIPVPIDSERETWNIDVNLIERKVSSKTKAIMPVHIYGHPCDMDPIMEIARKYKLYVIEDAAEAHGAEYKGAKAGGIGDIGCFSFYGNKIITTGEGGMLITDNGDIAERAKLLRNLAFGKKTRFQHHYLGFNYRMTNIEAAIGVAQLKKLDYFAERKRYIANFYYSRLKDISGLTFPVEKPWAKNVYWMYCLVIEDEFGINRDELMEKLFKKGIETRSMFIPMNQQPIFQKLGLFKNKEDRCPVAEELGRKGLYLPSGVGLTDDQMKYVCETIKALSKRKVATK